MSAGVGAIVLGLTSYIPTFVQVVLGTGPVVAGFALATLTLGWPVSASQSGRLYLRLGFRQCALIGSVLVVAGTLLLTVLDGSSAVAQVAATCFLIGLGLGLVATPTLIAAQSTVGWQERGVVTGNNLFCRSLGSALGVAVFGAIANATLGSQAAAGSGHGSRPALITATHHVFIAVAVLALVMTVAVASMPRDRGAGTVAPAAGQRDSDAQPA